MRLLGIEAARGFAALLVVAMHANDLLAGTRYFGQMPLGGALKFGHAGVDFFFVLSGFIIYFVHAADVGQPARLRGYIWKRFARIYPAYWVVLAAMGAVLAASPTAQGTERHLWNIVTSILLLPVTGDPILPVAWSLKHEMLFYVLFCVLFLNRLAGIAVLAVWGMLTAWNIAASWSTGTPYFGGLLGFLFFRLFNIEFFFGIFAAHLARAGRVWSPHACIILGMAAFVGNGLFESLGPPRPPEWPPRHLVYGISAGVALYGLAAAEISGRLRVWAPLAALGGASYSIYLVHVIVMMFLQQGLLLVRRYVPVDINVAFVFFCLAAVVSGTMFSALVELPLLAWVRRLRRPASVA